MNKEEERNYVFAQLSSLPNAFQYVSVTNYIENLEQQNKKLKEVIEKAIKCIEDTYYSKNTTGIDSIVLSNNDLLKIRKILKEVKQNEI